MPTVLITGAGRGLGFEFARQYAADNWRVIATCRTPEAADALSSLAGAVSVHMLDVADLGAIEAFAADLQGEAIDLLLNNAGILFREDDNLGGMDYGNWLESFRINTMAPMKMIECFRDYVGRSDQKKIICISSQMASIANNPGGAYAYRSSKAALNAVCKGASEDLKADGIIIAMLHPGWVRTDMGGPNAAVSVEDSVSGLRQVIAALGPGDTGRFLTFQGEEIPW